jgi:hypothetical protein
MQTRFKVYLTQTSNGVDKLISYQRVLICVVQFYFTAETEKGKKLWGVPCPLGIIEKVYNVALNDTFRFSTS